MKAYRVGGVVPSILDLGTTWRWVVSLTFRPFHPQGKSSWYPLERRLGGKENKSQLLPGLETLIIQPVAQCYISQLSRLLMLQVQDYI